MPDQTVGVGLVALPRGDHPADGSQESAYTGGFCSIVWIAPFHLPLSEDIISRHSGNVA